MKKTFATAVIICLSIFCVTAQGLRLASYNIRNGVGMDNVKNLERTVKVLHELNAEIIAVQEVDSMTGRSGQIDVLKILAEKTGMHRSYGKAIDYDGGGYGIGILSKDKPKSVKVLPLPGREEQRALIVADFGKYIFMATHLSLTGADQLLSLQIIDSLARECRVKRVFVAGDFNLEPGSEQFKYLEAKFSILSSDQKTCPASEPNARIDYIVEHKKANKKPSRVIVAQVVEAVIESDHRPIIAEIKK